MRIHRTPFLKRKCSTSMSIPSHIHLPPLYDVFEGASRFSPATRNSALYTVGWVAGWQTGLLCLTPRLPQAIMAGKTRHAWLLPRPQLVVGARWGSADEALGAQGAWSSGMGQTALSESLRGIEADIAARQLERALMLSQDMQTRYPRALAVQRVIGEVYLAMRKTREAIGALDRALAGDPEDARVSCARAIVQQIQGDSMGALAWYRRACDIRPSDKVLLSAYRELAHSLNQPAYTPSRIGLARLYLRGDLFSHAIREWETVLAERPDALEAHVGLAETLWRARNAQAAADRCHRLLLNSPSCVKALLILAAIEHDAGSDDEAHNQLRRAAELDPDMRIARELFADRLAANDRALSLLVFGEEPPASRRLSRPLARPAGVPSPAASGLMAGSLTGAPGALMGPQPGVSSQSAAQTGAGAFTPSQPLAPRAPHTTGALPPPAAPGMSPAAYATNVPASRPNGLPPDFHRIFSETKDMLWHDDAEGQETQSRLPGVQAFERSRVDPFARSQVVMPPALMDANGSLEDTEARLAINFLNWLQAQGAVAQNIGMPGAQGATGPVPVPRPARQLPTGQSLSDPRFAQGPDNGAETLQTGPLPPPTSAALKAMFAELGPETGARRVVDADVVSARDASDEHAARDDAAIQQSYERDARAEYAPDARVSAGPAPAAFDADATAALGGEAPGRVPDDGYDGDVPAAQQPEALRPSEWAALANPAESATENPPAFSSFSGFAPSRDEIPAESATDLTPPLASGRASEASSGTATTLEALEQGFAKSGFESFELRPGELATLASQAPSMASGEQPPTVSSGSDSEAPAPEMARDAVAFAAPAPEPEPAPAPPGPASDDYAGRLSVARDRRAAGNLDDALGEYRIILKNAPDLLGDVMDELNESLTDAPEHPEVHRLLGDAHIRQGDYLSALESYNRAVALTQAQGS